MSVLPVPFLSEPDAVRHLLIMGDELKSGLMFLDCVEMWARKQGAMQSHVIGREGFLRVLGPYGYRKQAVALSKDISWMREH